MVECLVRMDAAGSAVFKAGDRWTIGHAGSDATWQFQLGIAAEEWIIRTEGDRFSVSRPHRADSPTSGGSSSPVSGEASLDRVLREGDELAASGLTLRFRQPHPWTRAAVLERVDGPRAIDGTDAMLLANGPVLLGVDTDSHLIVPPAASGGPAETIALFIDPESEANDPTLAWKLVSGPLDTHPVNRLHPPTFLETDTLRVAVEPR